MARAVFIEGRVLSDNWLFYKITADPSPPLQTGALRDVQSLRAPARARAAPGRNLIEHQLIRSTALRMARALHFRPPPARMDGR